jgi:hypothetical protein
MDFNATIDLIIKDLNNALEIIDDLKSYPGVPAFQVELAKSKCKSSSELIALLKTLPVDPVSDAKNSTFSSPQSPLDQQKPEPEPEHISLIPDPPVSDAISSSLYAPCSPLDQPQLHLQDSYIIADSFSHMSNRFNEHLGELIKDDTVPDFNKSGQVSNLSEAIGVNDRFLFIREIFNDNKEAYIEAIRRLDSIESLSDARVLILSYAGNSNENEAVKQLLDLVKRKLSSNE